VIDLQCVPLFLRKLSSEMTFDLGTVVRTLITACHLLRECRSRRGIQQVMTASSLASCIVRPPANLVNGQKFALSSMVVLAVNAVNQSISRFLQWPKWCNQCKDHLLDDVRV